MYVCVCVSYEEEDTCIAVDNADGGVYMYVCVCVSYEEEDTCIAVDNA